MNDRSDREACKERLGQFLAFVDGVAEMLADIISEFSEQSQEAIAKVAEDVEAMKRARAEDQSVERAQQREDQLTHNQRVKATIKHHCKAHYSTNRKATHRARDTI